MSPKKLPPIHPGEILEEEFLRPMNITQYRLAKSIGVDARRVHAIVNGERSISAETALLFSRFFGNSAEFWMGLQGQYKLETAEDRILVRQGGVMAHSAAGGHEAEGRKVGHQDVYGARTLNTLLYEGRTPHRKMKY